MAVQNLLKHGGTALAGGVNLMLAESTTAAALVAGMLTSDGHCKTLDASADGYVRAEACIVVRLESDSGPSFQAQAIIAGTFVNQVCKTANFPYLVTAIEQIRMARSGEGDASKQNDGSTP